MSKLDGINNLEEEAVYNPYKPHTAHQTQRTCPRCNSVVTGNFCSICGFNLSQSYQNQPKKKKKISPILIIAIALWLGIGAFVITVMIVESFNSSVELAQQGVENIQQSIETENTYGDESQLQTETQVDEFDEEAYMNSCSELDYITVARNPDAAIGQRVHFICKVEQLIDGLFRVYAEDSEGEFYTYELILTDYREDKQLRILDNDILEVYGTVEYPISMIRSLSGTNEEVMHIKGMIINILANGEDQYKSLYKTSTIEAKPGEINAKTNKFSISTTGEIENTAIINETTNQSNGAKEVVYNTETELFNATIYCYYPVIESGDYKIKLELDNKSQFDYKIKFSNITVNGYQFYGGYIDAAPNNKAVDTIDIHDFSLEEAGITEIESIVIPVEVQVITKDNGLTYSYLPASSFNITITPLTP